MLPKLKLHFKCRNNLYPLSNIQRFPVSDEQVQWNATFDNYNPTKYEANALKNKPWADLDVSDNNFQPKWNALDGKINRVSYMGEYSCTNNTPQNPVGRTGIIGRGLLGRWGPNHAADPIVTRWKRNINSQKVLDENTRLPALQFCAIQRRDCNEWAIPGGMIDPGEQVSETLRREFMEEALNSLEKNVEKEREIIANFFSRGVEIYSGYVDDPRNTDNAWMETVAYNFHDDTGEHVGRLDLNAGDDARKVKWMDINRNLVLYASHVDFIQKVVQLHGANW